MLRCGYVVPLVVLALLAGAALHAYLYPSKTVTVTTVFTKTVRQTVTVESARDTLTTTTRQQSTAKLVLLYAEAKTGGEVRIKVAAEGGKVSLRYITVNGKKYAEATINGRTLPLEMVVLAPGTSVEIFLDTNTEFQPGQPVTIKIAGYPLPSFTFGNPLIAETTVPATP